jgi:hypothetical protein
MRRQRRRHRRREEKRRRVEPHGAPFATPRRKHSSDARAERSTLATGSSGPASRKHPPPPGGAERWDPRADRPAKALCSVDVEAELAPAEDAAPKQSIGDAARARFSTERRALRQFMADGGEEAFGESRGGARQACVALAAAERAGLPLCRPMAAEESERSFIGPAPRAQNPVSSARANAGAPTEAGARAPASAPMQSMSPSGFAAMWQERDRQSSPEVPVPAPCPLVLSVCPVPLRPMPIQQLSPGGLLGSGLGSTAHPLHGVVPPAPPPSLVEQALGVAGKRNPASAAAAAAMSQHRQLNSRAHHFQPLGVSVSPAASAGSPPLLPGRPPPRLQGIGLVAVQSMKPGQGTPPTAAPSPLELLQQRSDMSQVRVREQRAAAERVKRKSEQDLRSAARSRVNEQAYADQVADFLRTQQDGVSDTSAIGNKVPRAAGARKLSHVLKS